MPRYKLRTLLILLAVLPPLLWIGWGRYQAWRAEQERHRRLVEAQARFAAEMEAKAPARRAAVIMQRAAIAEQESQAVQPPQKGSADLEHGKGPSRD